MTPEDLAPPEYELLAEMTHASLGEFLVEYFIRRGSWLTRMHHAMSLATIAAIVGVAWHQGKSWGDALQAFGLAFVSLFVIVLPLHELVHALAYRIGGARDIRWDYSWRMAAAWVMAHRFVADRRTFVFVALAPFVAINAAILLAALVRPGMAVYLLCLLLWHLHGSSGDWGLLNFIWLHREQGFWTYDDADSGKSWFYGRARDRAVP